ncbi:MAG: heme-binding protein [Woeseiaceae bacterium]|nr:heme-binding protein [Woeseiaceae bacterium]|tara:strand:- start:1833 stop:2507 length:675 start_codon:yes stop_codon:yes gene_type:complete
MENRLIISREKNYLLRKPRVNIFSLLIFIFWGTNLSALEEPKYSVLKEYENFEIRNYDSYLVAEVDIEGSYNKTGNEAFRILAGYIFGDNQSSTKMNMTAPVESEAIQPSERMNMTAPVFSNKNVNGYTYRFVMESKYTQETLPVPNNSKIRITEIKDRVMAVISFSGRWSQKNFEKHEQILVNDLKNEGIGVASEAIYARYNAPFTPWFLRRNEIMFEIEYKN